MILKIQTDQALDFAVDQITKSSISLAEATANYGALRVIFGVFMIFMIFIVIVFVYQIFTLTKKIDSIHQAAIATNNFFNDVSHKTIGNSQSQVLIRRSINSLSHIIKYSILRIRLENNISDRVATENKVNRVVNNEYSELYSFLNTFIYDGRSIGEIMDNTDIEVIKDFMLEQIYSKDFNVSSMEQSASILFNGIKLSYIKQL